MRLFGLVPALCLTILLSACNQANTRSDTLGKHAAQDNVELATLYMREGKKAIALEVLQKALEQDPDLPEAHNAIAVLYDNLGENDKADKHFRRALSLNPKESQAHNNYGSFLCKAKRWDDAEEHYLKAAANPLYDTPELSYTNAGTCASSAEDYVKAEKYWRMALERNARYPSALLQMARLGVTQKNYLSARAYLQRLHDVIRPNSETLWLGIQTEQALGDKNAVSSYSMLLKNRFPESPQAKLLQEKRLDDRNTGN